MSSKKLGEQRIPTLLVLDSEGSRNHPSNSVMRSCIFQVTFAANWREIEVESRFSATDATKS